MKLLFEPTIMVSRAFHNLEMKTLHSGPEKALLLVDLPKNDNRQVSLSRD